MQPNSVVDIKSNNIRKIIDVLRFDDKYKKDIASCSDLSFATVSNICRELVAKGVLKEISLEDKDARVGRSPKLISLNHDDFLGICIDIHNRNHMVLAITNLHNEILIKKEIAPKDYDDINIFVADCYDAYITACKELGVSKKKFLGGCVAIPAIFDSASGLTVVSGNEFFEGQPLKGILEEKFKLPFYLDNEANILSAAIALQGTEEIKNLVYVFCSEGLGIGIIVDGKLLRGYGGYASEICHIPIGSEKLVCHLCGNTGCIESDLSISGFVAKYLNYTEYDKDKIDVLWENFLCAVDSGEPKAIEVLHENAVILGRLLSIIMNLFDPEIIYFGGDVAALFEKMKPVAEQEAMSRLCNKNLNRVWLAQDKNRNSIINGCAEIIYKHTDFSILEKVF